MTTTIRSVNGLFDRLSAEDAVTFRIGRRPASAAEWLAEIAYVTPFASIIDGFDAAFVSDAVDRFWADHSDSEPAGLHEHVAFGHRACLTQIGALVATLSHLDHGDLLGPGHLGADSRVIAAASTPVDLDGEDAWLQGAGPAVAESLTLLGPCYHPEAPSAHDQAELASEALHRLVAATAAKSLYSRQYMNDDGIC